MEAERLQALPHPLRLLIDTLRVLPYRAETAIATAVAPALDNRETARSPLKSLFRSVASLHPDESAGTLSVRRLQWPEPRVEAIRRDQSHRFPRQPALATGNSKRPERSVAQEVFRSGTSGRTATRGGRHRDRRCPPRSAAPPSVR